jgi:hypothetical protein
MPKITLKNIKKNYDIKPLYISSKYFADVYVGKMFLVMRYNGIEYNSISELSRRNNKRVTCYKKITPLHLFYIKKKGEDSFEIYRLQK